MPNVFKNAVKSNITTEQTVYATPASMSTILLELDIANTTTTSATIDIKVTDSSTLVTSYLLKAAPVPVGSTLQAISGQKIVLEAQDSVKVISTTAVDVVASLLEDV
jgi:hypothetical protein